MYIYSASVNPPDSPYTYLLTGNTLFDTVYSTFNATGVLAIGGILFAAGVIFALRTAPNPDEIKNQLEEIKTRIKSKPLPFLSKGKGKGSESFYGAPSSTAFPEVPTFSASPIYNPPENDLDEYRSPKPITFNFDVLEEYNNKRNIQGDNFIENLIKYSHLGEQPGLPYSSKIPKKKVYVHFDYPAATVPHSTSQVIEPVFTEVKKTLTESLGNFDFEDNNLIGNRRLSEDYDDEDETEDDETDETYDNFRYMPTLPPIYPKITKRPYIPLRRKQVKPSRRHSRLADPQHRRGPFRRSRLKHHKEERRRKQNSGWLFG